MLQSSWILEQELIDNPCNLAIGPIEILSQYRFARQLAAILYGARRFQSCTTFGQMTNFSSPKADWWINTMIFFMPMQAYQIRAQPSPKSENIFLRWSVANPNPTGPLATPQGLISKPPAVLQAEKLKVLQARVFQQLESLC